MGPPRDEAELESRRRRRRATGLGLATYGAYQLVNLLRGRTSTLGRRNAAVLIEYERRLSIDIERRVQQAFLRRPAALHGLNAVYVANQVALTPLAMWVFYRLSPRVFQAASRRILFVMFGGTVWHAIQPMAPPRLMDIGIVDTVSDLTLWDLQSTASRSLFNPTAAMPSTHVALSVLTGKALWELDRGPWVKALGVAYPVAIGVAVVATGNHFVLDIVGGVALAALALAVFRVAPEPIAVRAW